MLLSSTFTAVTVAMLAALPAADAFYLPGTAPKDYKSGEPVLVSTNAIAPMLSTKLMSMISYDYYDERLHMCAPKDGAQKEPESLGSILFGDRVFSTPFDIAMLQNVSCQTLCLTTVPKDDAAFINQLIREDYGYNFLVDGLMAAEVKIEQRTGEKFYDVGGVNLGQEDESNPEVPVLNNHFDIILEYHTRDNVNYRIVGVLVYPRSTASIVEGKTEPNCQAPTAQVLSETSDNQIFYTYSVGFVESSVPWAVRWDKYLHVFDPKIHWFSLINSIVIVAFLCVMVSTILYRHVSNDINKYHALDLSEDMNVQEDQGWKLLHGEVFRAPSHPLVLSTMVGTGAQLSAMVAVTLVFALFGFLSPSLRGSLASTMLVFWTLFSCVNGYVSTRIFLSFGGEAVKKLAFLSATLFPTIIFAVIFLLNLFLVGAGSSGAIPFGTILAVVVIWFLISVPLTIAGVWFGIRHGALEHPTRVNPIPRQIPPGPTYLKKWPAAALAGLLPWAAAFVELFFVLSSLFGSKAYYAFGFLFLTLCIVILTTATITVLFTYFSLCAENYRWHWYAFTTGAGSSLWLFLYGLFYMASRLSLDSFTSVVLYLGYLLLLCLANFLISGSIGFIASYVAIRKLYAAVRID